MEKRVRNEEAVEELYHKPLCYLHKREENLK
jgi:hypothetical protein